MAAIREEVLNHPLGDKLWTLSRVLSCSPFDPAILSLTTPQMTWILARYAKENPEKIRLLGPDGQDLWGPKKEGREWAKAQAAWDRVLAGKALAEHQGIDKMRPSLEAIARMRAEGRLGPAQVDSMQARVEVPKSAKASSEQP